MEMKRKIETAIQNADLVLVGIGEEFACSNKQLIEEHEYADLIASFLGMEDKLANKEDVAKAYEILGQLLKDKNYFIVTENADGEIFKSSLNKEKIVAPCYEEVDYLPMWDKYMKWLQGTLNKNLCILELGVGFGHPTIIRWPFEKIGYLNQKAEFFRIHHSLYQLSEELQNKGISNKTNAVDFLRNTFVQ